MAKKRQCLPTNIKYQNKEEDIRKSIKYYDNWMWSKRHRSQEVMLTDAYRKAYFHPNWSKGTAGVRGTHSINNSCRHYWEIHVSQRIFGTSMMFGIGTKDVRLHADRFTDMLGEDENGWGLSHKGLLWHGGTAYQFTKLFKENVPTKIGILFDGIYGTLTYYKDGCCLGVAFRNLNKIKKPLYPIIMSTAAKTEMFVTNTYRDFPSLKDQCCVEILKHIQQKSDIDKLELPVSVTKYLKESYCEDTDLIQVDNCDWYSKM